ADGRGISVLGGPGTPDPVRLPPPKGGRGVAEGDEELEPEVPEPDRYGLQDHLWDDERWHRLLETLITESFFTWKDVAVLALGQSNPPQVGTSIASNKNFQQNHREEGGRSVMQQVYDWLYEQTGRCADCGSRLDLQADHIDPRQDAIE